MVGDWFAEKVRGVLEFIIKDMAGSYSNELWQHFARLFGSPIAFIADPTLSRLQEIATIIALSALPGLLAFAVVRRLLTSWYGENREAPEALIVRAGVACVSVMGVSLYAWFMGTFADYLVDILGAYGLDISFLQLYFSHSGGGLTPLLLTLLFLIIAAVVAIQRAILGLEFGLLLILGRFIALKRFSDEGSEAWQTWKREIIACIITPVLQLLVLLIFARRMSGVDPASLGRWIESSALFYLLWNMPRWARQFSHTTGTGHSLAGAATGASRFVVMRTMMRAAIKR